MAGWAPTAAEVEELARAGSWSVDLATREVWWSPALGALHGVHAGTVGTVEDWAALVHPEDRSTWRAACDAVLAGQPLPPIEHRIVRPDGSVRWLQCRAVAGAGEVRGVSVDVTSHRDRAESLLAFVADAAHELRTPVDAIGLAVSALEVASEEARGIVVEVLARQTARLRALTNDVIDLARLESGHPVGSSEPERVDVAAAACAAVEHAPAPPGRSVAVEVEPGLAVLAAAVHLDQVLVNLLTNAYRYGGPHVTVRARANGDRVELEVADDGEGVPPDSVETVFEPFRRAGAASAGSSGLGLAIVARVVRRFGGSIRYEPGDPGARFVVDLPAVR